MEDLPVDFIVASPAAAVSHRGVDSPMVAASEGIDESDGGKIGGWPSLKEIQPLQEDRRSSVRKEISSIAGIPLW